MLMSVCSVFSPPPSPDLVLPLPQRHFFPEESRAGADLVLFATVGWLLPGQAKNSRIEETISDS